MASQRWLIYALGGGLGHLTRALALGRAAIRRGHRVRILASSPLATAIPAEAELAEMGELRLLDPSQEKSRLRQQVLDELATGAPDLVVVDTFPRGLLGELASLLEKPPWAWALVHRDLSPRYVTWADLRGSLDSCPLVILPGEAGPLADHPRVLETSPWLIRDHHELLSRSDARRRLGVEAGDSRPLVAVVGSGRPEELDEAAAIAQQLRSHLGSHAIVRPVIASAPPDQRIWPLLELMAGVDVVVGSGGYNTVNEARATGRPLVALARERLYDRQAQRLQPGERATSIKDVLERASEQLQLVQTTSGELPNFDNGVHAAVVALENLGL